MIYAVKMVIFSAVPFYITSLNNPLRSVSFFVYLSMLVILCGFLGSVHSFPIAETIFLSGGNLVYGAFMMMTILFVVIEKDVGVMRQVIRLVIGVDIFSLAVSSSISWALGQSDVLNPLDTSDNHCS